MKLKLPDWEIVLFVGANAVCALNYIIPLILIVGLFMIADLNFAAYAADSTILLFINEDKSFIFIYFLLYSLWFPYVATFVLWKIEEIIKQRKNAGKHM